MENHPIPQDVTGFKFRLIGSITLKQFLYLLAAGALSLVVYFLPIPLLAKIPFIGIFALIGSALAFVPIDGRPMDRMIMNFLKALPAENEYLYHKRGAQILAFDFVQPAHARHQVTQMSTRQTQIDASRALVFSQLRGAYQPDTQELASLKNIHGLFNQDAGETPITHTVTHADAAPAPIPKPDSTPTPQLQPTPAPQPQAQMTPVQPAHTAQSIPDSPNVIFGTVTDPRGKILPQVLVEVLDQNQVPVRTLKTNQVGEFRSATPLPNGSYTIHLEDSLHKQDFTPIPIALNNTIMQPFVIKSVDLREKLRQELFGGGV